MGTLVLQSITKTAFAQVTYHMFSGIMHILSGETHACPTEKSFFPPQNYLEAQKGEEQAISHSQLMLLGALVADFLHPTFL